MIFLKRRALMTRASFNYKTVSGIGSITLENCVETRFKRLSLSGNSVQTTTKGLQLLDKTKIPTPQAGVAYYNMQVEEGKYTLSTKYRRAVQKDLFLFAGEVDTGASSDINGVDSTISRTVESINGYITIGYRKGENGVNPFDFETMLNKGDTPLPYEPYTGGKPSPSVECPQEIVSAGKYDEVSGKYVIDVSVTGKNLFDISKNKYKCDEEKICIPSKILVEFNITAGITFEEKTEYFLSWESYIITKPNSYWTPIFGVEYTDKTREEFYMHLLKNGAKTNANKTIKYVYIRNPWSVGIDISRIQIEKGNERTEYEPYHEPQTIQLQLDEPLRGIGEYKDVITKDGVLRNVSEGNISDNLQNVIYGQPGEKYIFSSFKNSDIRYDKNRCMSNVGFTSNQSQTRVMYVPVPYQSDFLIKVADDDTVETVKEKTKNITVVYVTKTPIFEPLPQETQLALENLHANDGTTIITVDSGEVETGIEVEYAAKS